MNRNYLRGEFEAGRIGKHDYSRKMSELHGVLVEYTELLQDTDIAAIEITERGVILSSRLAPVRFHCDPRDRGIPPIVALDFRRYERKDFAMLSHLVSPGATVFDVGANIGWYTVHLAARDRSARVLAFEPVPATFAFLESNIRLNALGNAHAFPVGVAAESGTQLLYVDARIAGAASAAPSTPAAELDAQPCRMTTLDDVTREQGVSIDMLKIDVEGGELGVLQGGLRSISEGKPVIFAEMLRKLSAPFGYHPNEIIGLLRQAGYGCYRAEETRLVAFEAMDDETAETNFFFLHRERHDRLVRELTEE